MLKTAVRVISVASLSLSFSQNLYASAYNSLHVSITIVINFRNLKVQNVQVLRKFQLHFNAHISRTIKNRKIKYFCKQRKNFFFIKSIGFLINFYRFQL